MPPRLWRFRIEDILEAIAQIRQYAKGMTFDDFSADQRTIDAVKHNFVVMGEAAGHVPEEITSKYPSIPWREMIDMRNVATHEYWQVSLEVLWGTTREQLPGLVPTLERILDEAVE